MLCSFRINSDKVFVSMAAAWSLDEALADEVDLDKGLCKNLVRMIDKEQCTLPFIARYYTTVISLLVLHKKSC